MRANFFAVISVLISIIICFGIELHKKTLEITNLNEKIVIQIGEIETQKNKLNLNLKNNILTVEYGEKYLDFAEKLENFEEIDLVISLANIYNTVNWKYFVCQIYYESDFNPNAISNENAKGYMQITSFIYSEDIDPYNPINNIFIGITYWNYLYNKYNDVPEDERILFTTAAYNCGPTRLNNIIKQYNIISYNDIEKYLPKETQKYVNNIINLYNNII